MIVTVDIIPFRLSGCADKGLEVLLIKRSNPERPYTVCGFAWWICV